MEDIFEIRLSFEQKAKEEVILKFSNKQGGDFNVFSFHWQCFVWAAIIGFLRDEKRPLSPPIADKPFSLNTMLHNGGEKDAQALICLVIAKAGTLDIMKNPTEAINLINEYANGGFYHIMRLMENGENTFNDVEKVKQEIFSRNYGNKVSSKSSSKIDVYVVPEEAYFNQNSEDLVPPQKEIISSTQMGCNRISHRWSIKEENDLVGYYEAGMTIDQLAKLFGKDVDTIKNKLSQKGIVL